MIRINKDTRDQLLKLYEENGISLEGNILKLIDSSDDEELDEYLTLAIERDKDKRRKRLDITKRVQSQNKELTKSQKENDRVNKQLTKALGEAEQSGIDMLNAKDDAIKAKEEAEASQIESLHQKRKAEKAKREAEDAKTEAENARISAETDLELVQKKSQFELIGKIVRIALWIIVGVGMVTTSLYVFVILQGIDSTIIGSTWTNIISILLTNSFSIIGTIMGVKYATKDGDN